MYDGKNTEKVRKGIQNGNSPSCSGEGKKSIGFLPRPRYPRERAEEWWQQYLEDTKRAFPGKGHLKPEEKEVRKLRKELSDVKGGRTY